MTTIFCSRCGESILADSTFCQKCGATVTPAAASPVQAIAPAVVVVTQPYAGFWIRVLAYLIDRIIVGILFSPVLFVFLARMLGELHRIAPNNPAQFAPIINFAATISVIGLVVQWLYEALLTSSSWQATIGKRVLDLKVTDEDSNRISFEQATGRFFAKILSGLLLCIGFLMVAFTERKQGLHDIIAGTLVWKC